jgi:dTDP-4-amino-4,6-dideoxygalactose transaminase
MTTTADHQRPIRTAPLPFARPSITEDEIAEVVDTLRSGWITTGPKTARFEEEFRRTVDTPAALAVSSGTAAMHLALVALGIGPGDRVFTTPMTFCSTAHVIEHVGARPVLVDIDPVTLNLDPDRLAEAVRAPGPERPAAVLPVHYAGHPVDLTAVAGIARDAGLAVVEDAAHAFDARYRGRPIGRPVGGVPGHAVCFSLYATKNITTGEGGVLTAGPELVERAREWSLHGMNRDAWRRYSASGSWRYDVLHPGFKYNFTDLQAALGLAQLRRHQELTDRRTEIAERYRAGLADLDELQLPTAYSDVTHAWHLYPLRLHLDRLAIDRAEFVVELQARHVQPSVHFIPLHELAYYRETYGWSAEDFPVAHREFTRSLSLPIYPLMSDDDADDVIAAVRSVVAAHRRRR